MHLNYKPRLLTNFSIALRAISVLVDNALFCFMGHFLISFNNTVMDILATNLSTATFATSFVPFRLQGVIEAIPYALYLVIWQAAPDLKLEEYPFFNTRLKCWTDTRFAKISMI